MPSFDSLKPEKRERILNAAMAEFVRVGFDRASTNQIVAAAKISKGSLFQYFGDKRGLFTSTLEYAVRTLVDAMRAEADFAISDPFDRLESVFMAMATLLVRHPDTFAFIEKAKSESNEELRREAERIKSPSLDALVDDAFAGLEGPFAVDGVDVDFVRLTVLATMGELFRRHAADGLTALREAVHVTLTRFRKIYVGT